MCSGIRINYKKESFCPRCQGNKPKGTYCVECGQHLRNHPRGSPSRKKMERFRYWIPIINGKTNVLVVQLIILKSMVSGVLNAKWEWEPLHMILKEWSIKDIDLRYV